ncbi:MAG TPA: GNAT family N-acetyltransferase [Roseiflexaceae bacterium]|jgi:aminoglycoside 2'-N-acetyltransferase I|nr:GNAT family N-acetyltransferase [Roseiflexaceae bacterium]
MSTEATIRVISQHALGISDRAEVLRLCSDAFHCDYAPFLEACTAAIHVLASMDGQIVSHALWITRWLQVGAGPLLRTAYVEGVATAPAYERRGLATAVMQTLQAQIADFDIGGLSPAQYRLYERLGWELWRGPLSARTAEGIIATPEEEAMILRLPRTPEIDLDAPLSVEWRAGEVW